MIFFFFFFYPCVSMFDDFLTFLPIDSTTARGPSPHFQWWKGWSWGMGTNSQENSAPHQRCGKPIRPKRFWVSCQAAENIFTIKERVRKWLPLFYPVCTNPKFLESRAWELSSSPWEEAFKHVLKPFRRKPAIFYPMFTGENLRITSRP